MRRSHAFVANASLLLSGNQRQVDLAGTIFCDGPSGMTVGNEGIHRSRQVHIKRLVGFTRPIIGDRDRDDGRGVTCVNEGHTGLACVVTAVGAAI